MSFRSLLLAATLAFTPFPARSQPSIDYHQQLLSPSVAKLLTLPNSFTARDLIRLLDAAGIRQALVLSMAYQYGDPNRPPVPDEYAAVQQENDWTAHQVADFPDRLRAFCGVDPLKSYAVSEVERCARDPYLHYGLKLHFGNSDVDLDDPQQVAELRRIFRTADEHGMAIVVHMRPSVHRNRPYGAREAETFLNDVLPSAPHVPIQLRTLQELGGSTIPRLIVRSPSLLLRSPETMREWRMSFSTFAESPDWVNGNRRRT